MGSKTYSSGTSKTWTQPGRTVTPTPASRGLSAGQISSIVIGILLFLALIGSVLWFCHKQKHNSGERTRIRFGELEGLPL